MLIADSLGGNLTDYPSVLDALREANVMTIKPMDGHSRVRERCDRYYQIYLTRDQVLAWADELRAMVDKGV
jgi:hypothetical protein